MAGLIETYADFPLGGTDASVIALAERIAADVVITLDRRDFAAVKPRHREALELLLNPKDSPPAVSRARR